jgi:hypothetical protein
MNTATQTAAKPGAAPEAPEPRKPLDSDSITFAAHSVHEDMRVVIPDGLTLQEVREHAAVYFSKFRTFPHPGSFLRVVDNSQNQVGLWFVRMCDAGKSTGLRSIEIIPLVEVKIGDTIAAGQATDDFYVTYTAKTGWTVMNGRAGVAKFTGLQSRAEAERICMVEKMNQPRKHGKF